MNNTDFNDFHRVSGLEAVRLQIENAKLVDPEPQAVNDEPLFIPISCFDLNMLDTEPPPREVVVSGMMPAGRVGGLVAMGGLGKSTLACLLGASVASGRDFIGFPSNQGPVLIVGAEDESEEFHRRLNRIIRDWPLSDRELATKNLYFESRTGTRNLLTESKKGGEVEKTKLAEQIISAARLINGLKLVILDPGSRFRGGEENSAEDTTRFVETLEYISIETNTAILLVHHANKQLSLGNSGNQNAARGSSALVDGLRFVFTMSELTLLEVKKFRIPPLRVKEIVKLSCAKSNYFIKFDDIYLDFSSGIKKVELVEQTKVKIEQGLDAVKIVLGIIEEYALKNTRFTKRAFCDSFSGKKKITGMSKNNLNMLLIEMLNDGDLILKKSIKGGYDELYLPDGDDEEFSSDQEENPSQPGENPEIQDAVQPCPEPVLDRVPASESCSE